MTDRHTEALEKLNQGIQESRREVQQRTMNLAQDYFSDSAEALKQQIKENRDTLQDLPDQIPGGREEVFQALFQELMDNYTAMEERINEAQENVANLDTDQIRRQGEVEATDAARRQAKELGIDLTQIEGTGADGRIIVSDVVEAAEAMEDGANGQAEQVAEQAQDAAGQATDQAGQVAGQAQ
ncbi:MAG: E3 binding domain-containing protein, partial [Actinomycetota bacterium]|nr:E3 binding domain-containing protein [Actinomycetota bacterium]